MKRITPTTNSNTSPRTSHNKDPEDEQPHRDPLRAPNPRQKQPTEGRTMSSRTFRCPRSISPSVQIPFLQVLMCDLCRCEVQSSVERCRIKMNVRRKKEPIQCDSSIAASNLPSLRADRYRVKRTNNELANTDKAEQNRVLPLPP